MAQTILKTYGPAVLALLIIWYILNIIANWKLLKKAGRAGFQSLIPVWNYIARFGISWSRIAGVIFLLLAGGAAAMDSGNLNELGQVVYYVAVFGAALLWIIEKFKLSKAFGHGAGFGFGLVFLEPLFVMILAFGKSRYTGRRWYKKS